MAVEDSYVKLREAVRGLQQKGLAPMTSAPVSNEAKAELSPFIQASKVVFDKSLELARQVLGNSNGIVGGAIVLASTGGGLLSFIALDASITTPQASNLLFGDTPQAMQVLFSASSLATCAYLQGVGKNIHARRPLLDPKGMSPGLG